VLQGGDKSVCGQQGARGDNLATLAEEEK